MAKQDKKYGKKLPDSNCARERKLCDILKPTLPIGKCSTNVRFNLNPSENAFLYIAHYVCVGKTSDLKSMSCIHNT